MVLGGQAPVTIGLSDAKLGREWVSAVRGRFGLAETLDRLLRGTNAQAVFVGASTIRIERRRRHAMRGRDRPVTAGAVVEPTAESNAARDIVVVGSKRSSLLRLYPGSVTVLSGKDVSGYGLDGSDALVSRLTNLNSTHLGPGRNKLFVRGIADSSFNGPSQATVGQYLGETRYNYNGPDPSLRLVDIERVEVLSGPQGSLYGAGSLGGIVRIVPRQPDLEVNSASLAADTSLTQQGDPGADFAATANLVMTNGTAAFRLAGYGQLQGGYVDVLHTSGELPDLRSDPPPMPPAAIRTKNTNRIGIAGGRASFRLLGGKAWSLETSLTGQRIHGTDAQYADRGSLTRTQRGNFAQPFTNEFLLADATVTGTLGNVRSVTTIGAVRQSFDERFDATDAPSSPVVPEPVAPEAFDQHNRITMLALESRLSTSGDASSSWVAGVSLLRNRSRQHRARGDPAGTHEIAGVENSVEEGALFGELTQPLASMIRVTVGGRLATWRSSGSGIDTAQSPVTIKGNETAFLPSAAIAFEVGDGMLLFARHQQGFRPGGLAVLGNTAQRYQSDRLLMWEAGVRSRSLFGLAIDVSAAAAYADWRNIQADLIDLDGVPLTANIGDGRIYTLDLSLVARPATDFTLEAAAEFNDSRVTNAATGIIYIPKSPLPNVPRTNLRLAAGYRAVMSRGVAAEFSVAARYTSKSLLGMGYILDIEQGRWLDLRAAAQLNWGASAVTMSVVNLLDTRSNRFALGSPFLLQQRLQSTPPQPRTVRIGFERKF